MAKRWMVSSIGLVMLLTAASASQAELSEGDKDVLSSVFAWCGTKVWSENLFTSVAKASAVSTERPPFEGTGRLIASHFHSGSRSDELYRYFEEHFDRDRFQRFYAWCDAEPARSILRTWILAPTLDAVRRLQIQHGNGKGFEQERRWQIARRLAHAQRAPELTEGIAAAWSSISTSTRSAR